MAILLREHDHQVFFDRIAESDACLPAGCYLETVMVLFRHRIGRDAVDRLVAAAGLSILACDERQARIAARAFERFGRGSGHKARLNFGDCLAYAAAKANDSPLLFKGDDFMHTDVAVALR